MGLKQDAPRKNMFMIDPDKLVIVGIDTAHKEGEHHLWDKRIRLPVDQELAKNIRAYGVIEPVVCETDGDDTFLVVDGRQRVRSARVAKKHQEAAGEVSVMVPVIFRRGDEKTMFGVARSANAHRRGDDVMTNAANAQRMLDMGAEPAEVAVTFGVKPQTVRDWTALLGLCAPVRKAIDAGEIAPSAAAALASLSKEDQEAHLEELRREGQRPTAERVAKKVRAKRGKPALRTARDRIGEAVDLLKLLYQRYVDGGEIKAADLDALAKALADKTAAEMVEADKAATAEAKELAQQPREEQEAEDAALAAG